MRWFILSTCLACNSDKDSNSNVGGLQAVGDSFLDWNTETGESIPDVMGELLNTPVQNNAISGALFSDPGEEDIRSQYASNGSAWLVMTGGGNDLNDECGCGDCTENLNEMIDASGMEGDLPTFVDSVLDDGPNVAILGYHPIPENADDFGDCQDELDTLSTRFAALAQQKERVLFVDARDFISAESTPEAYDEDLIHPSVEGSKRLGQALADAIAAHP